MMMMNDFALHRMMNTTDYIHMRVTCARRYWLRGQTVSAGVSVVLRTSTDIRHKVRHTAPIAEGFPVEELSARKDFRRSYLAFQNVSALIGRMSFLFNRVVKRHFVTGGGGAGGLRGVTPPTHPSEAKPQHFSEASERKSVI